VTYKWEDMEINDQKYFMQETQRELDRFRSLTSEASYRKSKLLTAGNAGGVITVVTYLGAVKQVVDIYIIGSLLIFLLGLVANGIAIFLTEKRYEHKSIYFSDNRRLYTNVDSDMTIIDYNNNLIEDNENYNKNAVKNENRLELMSGVSFLLATVVITIGMFINI